MAANGPHGGGSMTKHRQNLSSCGRQNGRLPKVVGVLAFGAVYWFPVRRWFSRWETTPEELTRAMPGDALIPNPTEMSMQAVTVNAPPEDIGHGWCRSATSVAGCIATTGLTDSLAFSIARVRLASSPSFNSSPWVTRSPGDEPAQWSAGERCRPRHPRAAGSAQCIGRARPWRGQSQDRTPPAPGAAASAKAPLARVRLRRPGLGR